MDLSGRLVQGVSPQIVCPWSSDTIWVVIECVVASVSLRLSGLCRQGRVNGHVLGPGRLWFGNLVVTGLENAACLRESLS